ncbi:MAG: ABC transporter permease [Bacilli bacterium]|nr:ABC transporter permease [Bacilli bacterium]
MINEKQFEKYNHIPQEKFTLVSNREIHDLKLDTKPVGYFKDAFRRFCKNKGSVVAAFIIIFLLLFAVVGPFVSKYDVAFNDLNLSYYLPKSKTFSFLGWDGYSKKVVSKTDYIILKAIEMETGENVIKKVYDSYDTESQQGPYIYHNTYYTVYLNSYTKSLMKYVQLTGEQYAALQKYQDDNELQIIYPIVSYAFDEGSLYKNDANVWYQIIDIPANPDPTKPIKPADRLNKGMPVGFTNTDSAEAALTGLQNAYIPYSGNDGYTSIMRVEENGEKQYDYARKVSGGNYLVRLNYNLYHDFLYGHGEPSFLFGSDKFGKDLFVCLSSGARFSLFFAICIAAINLFIGAIYGAIEGYYGGVADMAMERFSDILGNVPFMVVVTLFKLHIADKVGTVVTLLFAFVLTGWIGMASTTRMQFYRYKNQEYVLAARTLGASDRRIMFKHIFPNALGTLITSSVLVIPGVIFSESSLSYLGIINLSTGSTTSVGTLMATARGSLSTYPHAILFPAIFIALLMITFNLFGNGLRDAFNPSLRGSED